MLTETDLSAESLVAEAVKRSGAAPEVFLFREALERLVMSLDAEAELAPSARAAARAGLVNSLVGQARLAQLVDRYPDIEQTAIEHPVFITGMPRSGTTLLHNLLGLHPQLRAPLFWELASPATERGDARSLIAQAQDWIDRYYEIAPELKAVHGMHSLLPDECHRLMVNTFESMILETRYRVPSYQDWLRGRDLIEPYQYHRRQLQAILWRNPGRQAVLKCPFHIWSLEALIAAYPDARVVFMHRDPAETVPSMCSLCHIMRRARPGRPDPHQIGRQWLERIESALNDLGRARGAIPAGRILDVRYADLVGDPVGTVARVCDFAGVPTDEPFTAALRDHLAGNTREKHGFHRYRAADFGLDPADLDRRFTAYREEFQC